MKKLIWSRLYILVLVLAFTVGAFAQQPRTELTTSPKVLIFYSSIGMGHLSAARAIEQSVKAKDPKAIVILKDVRDFESKSQRYIGEKKYWFVVKNFPDLFDKVFRNVMENGKKVESLTEIKQSYNQAEFLKYIVAQGPTSIIATHYGSAQMLGNLREQGHLKDKPIGWLHTDYFKGYFPRISQRIESTFVGMKVLREQWLEEGIRPERVTTTGMPVNTSLFEPVNTDEFMRSKGLDPKIRTIVLASGGEGVGNFPLIVEQIAKEVKGPIQIIAVCAKNEKHVRDLTKMKPRLRSDIRLEIHGMVPNADLLSYIKSANLFITKSGGLSPTEGFAINKPMVLLDVYGGHERDNANLFEKEGLAVVNRNQATIGQDIKRVLESPEIQETQLRAQLAFRNSFNLEAITEFAFDSRRHLGVESYQIGLEMGPQAEHTRETLSQLERVSPADIEILLSYGKSFDGRYLGPASNPFGHLAVRVGDKVYSANGRAQMNYENKMIHETTLHDYLYATERPVQNMEMTDAFGSSYGRDNISLRVKGLSPAQLQAMHTEVEKIQDEWRRGETVWRAKDSNCGDFVLRILAAGGVRTQESSGWTNPKHITMPVDVFDTFKKHFDSRGDVRSEIVMYNQVPNSKSIFRTTRFPLSINQMSRTVKNLLFRTIDPVELLSGKRVKFMDGQKAVLENVNGRTAMQDVALRPATGDEIERSKANIKTLETELETLNRRLNSPEYSTEGLKNSINARMARLSAQDRALVTSGQPERIQDLAARADALSLYTDIQRWSEAHRVYQAGLDRLGALELRLLMQSTWTTMLEMRRSLYQFETLENGPMRGLLDEKLRLARVQYNKYFENEAELGKPKDGPLRTDASRQFFSFAKDFFDRANSTSSDVVKFWDRLKTKSAQVYRRVRLVIKLSPAALKMVVTLWTNPNATPDNARFLETIQRIFQTIGNEANVKVEIKGAEHLPKDMRMQNKTVYVVAPTHRDPILDGIIMSRLPMKNFLLVMAPNQFVPEKLVGRVSAQDSVIPVGGGSNIPVDKILAQLSRGVSNTILIYPEGSVSAGLAETRPVREKFNWGLIERLRVEGYDVKLIPVTYKDSGQLLHHGSVGRFFESLKENAAPRTVNVSIGEPVDGKVLDLLAKADSSQAIGRFIRATWLEGLATNKDYLGGMVRIDAAMERSQRELINRTELNRSIRPSSRAVPQSCRLIFN